MPTGYELYRMGLKVAADANAYANPRANGVPRLIREGLTVAGPTATDTLTSAQNLAAVLTCDLGAAATLTTMTGANLALELPGMVVGDCFYLTVVNTSPEAGRDVTMAAAASGITATGDLVVDAIDDPSNNSSGKFRFRKTGADAFTMTRVG